LTRTPLGLYSAAQVRVVADRLAVVDQDIDVAGDLCETFDVRLLLSFLASSVPSG